MSDRRGSQVAAAAAVALLALGARAATAGPLRHATLAGTQDQGAAESPLEKAEADLAAGRLELALARFQKLAEAPDAGPRVLVGLGRAQLALGDATGAVAAFSRACRDAGDGATLLLLAQALLEQARQALAQEEFETAEYALLDARRYFDLAAEQGADRGAARLGAARVERLRGDAEQALALAVEATTAAPDDVEAFLELGSLRYGVYWQILGMRGAEAARDAAELCRRAYSRALEIDPACGPAENGLGWLARQSGDLQGAVAAFARSLSCDPTLEDSYRNLELLLGATPEERARHLKILNGIVSRAATYRSGEVRRRARAKASFERGRVHLALGDPEQSKRDFREASRLEPALESACAYHGALGCYRDGRRDEAAAALARLVAKDLDGALAQLRGDPRAHDVTLMVRGLADLRYRADQLEEARDLFHLVAAARGDEVDDWNNYAFLCRETGHYEEAYAGYSRALELEPDNPAILNDAALILHYHLRRDLELARDLYQRAMAAAEATLADDAATSAAKERAATALDDARTNLARLAAGQFDERGVPGRRRP